MQPDFSNKTWVQDGYAQKWCAEHHTSSLCVGLPSNYEYKIWLAPNAFFMALYSLSLIGFILTYILTRRGFLFNLAMCLGLVCEILGYAGRIISWNNQWDNTGFFLQIVLLTIGPVFMAGAIYLCLRHVVLALGPEHSRIPPKYYTRIFIPCDIISLVLQALGGALAANSVGNKTSSNTTGTDIMIAGLSFQVFTLVIFLFAAGDFALRVRRTGPSASYNDSHNQSPDLIAMRSSRGFKAFLMALGVASVLILWRSAFRVAELCEGWSGKIIGNQGLFIAFEGVLITAAVVLLNVCNPAVLAKSLFERRRDMAVEKRGSDSM